MVTNTGIIHAKTEAWEADTASAKNISLLKKPFSNGTPAIASEAIMARAAVCGIYLIKPLILRMSLVPVSWSIIPATINSEALKVA